MRRCARRVPHASDPAFDAVDPRQGAERNKQVQGAKDGSPADAATRELTDKLLGREGLPTTQRGCDDLATRGCTTASGIAKLPEDRARGRDHN